jgi:cell division protein FtsB
MSTHGPPASSAIDVTRIEHENLYGQVLRQLSLIHQLETEMHRLQARITAIEQRLSPGRNSTT